MGARRGIVILVAGVMLAAGCGGAVQPAATATSGGSVPAAATAGSIPGTATAGGLVAIGSGLSGPAGLEATVYARGLPAVSAFASDPQGRLWVATAAATDQGHDGVFMVSGAGATPLLVVAGVHTPLGLLWYQGSLYVASRSRVDAYSGFDGTRFTAVRSVVSLPAGVGEVNGIVAAPDGSMLLGISAPCDHCTPVSPTSASIVSFRPDGTGLQVYASGIRAPVGLTFYPGTSDLFVTVDQRDDLGGATPGDWLAVVGRGQAWGFPQCWGQGGAVCSGVPAPTAVLDPHAGVDGVAITASRLGPVAGGSALVAEWASGKVQRVQLTRVGASYAATVEPFLTGMTNPGPVAVAPDGAVLVGDWATGTVYRVAAAAAAIAG